MVQLRRVAAGLLVLAPAVRAAFNVIPPEQQKQQLDDSAHTDPSSVGYVPSAKALGGSHRTTGSGNCTNPEIRLEWRDASDDQRNGFTSAIQCLTTKPPRSGLPATYSLWDDLTAIHHGMINVVHGNGAFLHWHRYFVWTFLQELRNSCDYKGPMLWWDETKDAGHFGTAPMFNGDYFGDLPSGNYPLNITNGKFANLPLHIGPGPDNTNRTLNRQASEEDSARVTTDVINTCWAWNAFANMTSCVESGPHGSGHNAIGGIMGDVWSSAGDPIFFLHHAFVDHVFYGWQEIDPNSRSMAVGGIANSTCTESCEQVTLDYQLTSFGFADAHPIRDFADTMGGFLCYKYNY